MSILIRGMEMPKNCRQCSLYLQSMDSERNVYENCAVTAKSYNWGLTTRPSDCPLRPVPPHGRLIDAEAEIARVQNLYNKAVAKDPEMGCVSVYEGEIAVLKLAPTIIPAEEGE